MLLLIIYLKTTIFIDVFLKLRKIAFLVYFSVLILLKFYDYKSNTSIFIYLQRYMMPFKQLICLMIMKKK